MTLGDLGLRLGLGFGLGLVNILDKKYLGNVVGLSVSVTAGHLALNGVKGVPKNINIF